MDEALDLDSYLPTMFKNTTELEYIRFLWEAFDTNYTHGKYQFASLAYHMLTMSFVYFSVWKIKKAMPKDFAMGLIFFNKDTEKDLIDATTPFDFSKVNESHVLRFLKLIACDNSKIGTYAKLVRDRNEIAHSNGQVRINSPEMLDVRIAETLRVVKEIQHHSKPVIERCYREFLLQSHDPEDRQSLDDFEQIREVLIHENYLSRKDIDMCLEYDLTDLKTHDAYPAIEALHRALHREYGDSETPYTVGSPVLLH